jgi:hypothetical protein
MVRTSSIVVRHQIDERIAAAAQERLARAARAPERRPARISSAIARLGDAILRPVDEPAPTTPRLIDYPYRIISAQRPS